jgi:hypothetical protein
MTESRSLTVQSKFSPAICPQPPTVVEAGGKNARFAWDEFFAAQIRNPHTRTAYHLAIRKFFVWLEPRNIALDHNSGFARSERSEKRCCLAAGCPSPYNHRIRLMRPIVAQY